MITHNTKSNGMRTPTNTLPAANSQRPVDFAGNLSGVAHDITQLVELQGQLFVVDIKEAQGKLKTPIVLAIVGGLFGLCSMPLLLVAIAQGLVLAGLQSWAAYAIVSVTGLAIAGLLLWKSWESLQDSALVLDRSRAELAQNVSWLKEMLKCRSEAARKEAGCRN